MPEPEVKLDPKVEITGVRVALAEHAGRLRDMIEQKPEARAESWGAEVKLERDEIMALDARFTALQRSIEPDPIVGQGPQAANRQVSDEREYRSIGQQVAESAEFRAWAGEEGSGMSSRKPTGSVQVNAKNTRASTITGPTVATFTSGGAFAPIMPYVLDPKAIRRDRLYVRDLFPQTTTIYEVINYIGETYVSGSDATTVAEAGLKPQGNMNWYRASQNITKIGVWIAATLESLTDYGQLRGAIDNRLTYKVQREEEDRMINGNGTTPDVLGILNFPNIQTQAFSSNTFTTITAAINLIEQHDAGATGIVMNPADYWAAIAASSTTLLGAAPFVGPPDTLWGLPVARSPRQAANTAIVGDFKMGAEIFDRQELAITVGDQHSDFFIRNQVAILAEERLAVVCYRGDVFVNVTGVGH